MGLYTHAPNCLYDSKSRRFVVIFFPVRYMFGWFLTFSSHLSGETEESLEEKLRRGRCKGTFYKWIDDKETSGNEHYNNRILFALFVVFDYELLSRNSAVINIGILPAILIMSSLSSF